MTTGKASSAHNQLRHRCRRCGTKLPRPTDNRDRAFCCAGCHASYFKNRCAVCEAKLPVGPSNREICRRPECRARLRKYPQTYRWSKTGERPPRSARKTGFKIGTKSGRAYCKVAGPDLTETSFRLATLPLDPELVSRLDRAHAGFVESRKKAKRAAARKALIKRHHPPVNIVGGYKFSDAPAVDLSPIEPTQWAIPSYWKPARAGADVPDIPDFLRRTDPAVTTRLTAEDEADLAPEIGPLLHVARS
jgi:hypothetical protein